MDSITLKCKYQQPYKPTFYFESGIQIDSNFGIKDQTDKEQTFLKQYKKQRRISFNQCYKLKNKQQLKFAQQIQSQSQSQIYRKINRASMYIIEQLSYKFTLDHQKAYNSIIQEGFRINKQQNYQHKNNYHNKAVQRLKNSLISLINLFNQDSRQLFPFLCQILPFNSNLEIVLKYQQKFYKNIFHKIFYDQLRQKIQKIKQEINYPTNLFNQHHQNTKKLSTNTQHITNKKRSSQFFNNKKLKDLKQKVSREISQCRYPISINYNQPLQNKLNINFSSQQWSNCLYGNQSSDYQNRTAQYDKNKQSLTKNLNNKLQQNANKIKSKNILKEKNQNIKICDKQNNGFQQKFDCRLNFLHNKLRNYKKIGFDI